MSADNDLFGQGSAGSGPPQPPVYSFPSSIAAQLDATRPWVRLMSVLGFISVAFLGFIGLAGGLAGIATQRAELAILLIYPVFGLLYLFPSLSLYRYASRIADFVARGEQHQLEAALDAQRAFWKFVGILTLIGLVLTVMFMFVAVLAGVLTSSGLR